MKAAVSLIFATAALLCLGPAAGVSEATAQTGQTIPGLAVPGGISRPGAGTSATAAGSAQSGWVKGYNSTTRLIAGAEPSEKGSRRLLAGVEIRLADGWKTYWRSPGDDGGLPPSFDWAGSRNLKAARVLYPMPERLKSHNGTSLGYTRAVVFPVEIEPVDPAQPVEAVLAFEYGICREICVPAEAKLKLLIEPALATMPPDLASSLAKVPRPVENAAAIAQLVKSAKAVLNGPTPALTFDIATPGAGARADLLVEAPEGVYLPVPAKSGEPVAGVQRFRIDLKGVDEVASLAAKPLRLTVMGPGGAAELTWIVK